MRVRAAAAAALAALALSVGAAAYLVVVDDDQTSTTTVPPTTTSTTLSRRELLAAVAASLRANLDVDLTAAQAGCLADALLEVIGRGELAALSSLAEPLTGLDADRRDELVRQVVACVDPATAAALLGGSTSTTAPAELPDEGP